MNLDRTGNIRLGSGLTFVGACLVLAGQAGGPTQTYDIVLFLLSLVAFGLGAYFAFIRGRRGR